MARSKTQICLDQQPPYSATETCTILFAIEIHVFELEVKKIAASLAQMTHTLKK